jgi:hypothetical protein
MSSNPKVGLLVSNDYRNHFFLNSPFVDSFKFFTVPDDLVFVPDCIFVLLGTLGGDQRLLFVVH